MFTTLIKGVKKESKAEDCTCWSGYERIPGTKPCASGSCKKVKKSNFGAILKSPSNYIMKV